MSVHGNRETQQRFTVQAVNPHHEINILYLNSVFTASDISMIQIMLTAAAVSLLRGEGHNKGFQYFYTGLA